MQLYIALLPDTFVSNTILQLRKEVVDLNLGNIDSRQKVLPHTTILSFEEDIRNEKVNEIIELLNKLQYSDSITLPVIDITNWDQKVVAMFDIDPLRQLKTEVDALVRKSDIAFDTEYKKLYGNTIGDHMKLARQIKKDTIEEVKTLFRRNLPQLITFTRVVLIEYGCDEKDILWSNDLTTS